MAALKRRGISFRLVVPDTGRDHRELLRCRVEDIDFEAKAITFRERKRDKDRHSLRIVPMSAFLAKTLKNRLMGHAGGDVFYCSGSALRLTGFLGESDGRVGVVGHVCCGEILA